MGKGRACRLAIARAALLVIAVRFSSSCLRVGGFLAAVWLPMLDTHPANGCYNLAIHFYLSQSGRQTKKMITVKKGGRVVIVVWSDWVMVRAQR